MTTTDKLLDEIFNGKLPAFYPEFAGWVRGSRRFKAFATTYRGKIRAKLKNVRDDDGMNDLRAELETAATLLREEQFSLEYEKYAASKQRGPDFTVTFKTHTLFNVEVRRIRTTEADTHDPEVGNGKLSRALFEKVRQMPPRIVNLLWLTAGHEISEEELIRTATTLRQLAEAKNEDYFTRRGFESAADFLRHFVQLSGVVLRPINGQIWWPNVLARHKPPPDIVAAIRRLMDK